MQNQLSFLETVKNHINENPRSAIFISCRDKDLSSVTLTYDGIITQIVCSLDVVKNILLNELQSPRIPDIPRPALQAAPPPSVGEMVDFKKLHNNLDLLMSQYIQETGNLPSKTNLMDFAKWSYTKTQNHTSKEESNSIGGSI